ncbi:MAG: VWD domain-containing protein [Nitriliruptoraceae bacterium]|nr:VWD domain-containing protein [Nitriliruptoraceae bacterium]
MRPWSRRSLVLFVGFGLLAACSDDEPAASPDDAQASAEVELDAEPVDEAPEGVRAHTYVQDLWVIERYTKIADDGELIDLLAPIVAALGDDADQVVELPGEARLLTYDTLTPRLRDGRDDTLRDDVSMVGGLLEYEGVRALAILATPAPDGAPIQLEDEAEVDLTFLDELAPGDVTLADYALISATPTTDPQEATLGDAELFALRMEQQQVLYLGGEEMGGEIDEDGTAEVLLIADAVGMAREGSTYGGGFGKSVHVIDGIGEGLRGCSGGLNCASDVFKSTRQAFAKDMEALTRNLTPDPPPLLPPDRPMTEPPPGTPREEPVFGPPCFQPPCGGATGDPHLNTFAGPSYVMMGAGEFVLARNDDLEVQIRTTPIAGSRTASSVVATAVELGGVVVTFGLDDREQVGVDGESVARLDLLEPLTVGDATVASSGALIVVEDGTHRVALRPRPRHIDVFVQLDPADPRNVGLLGRVEGDLDAAVPWVTRDGEELDFLPRRDAFDTVYGELVPTWRLTDEESRFDYGPGESTATFTDPAFPDDPASRATLPSADVARAEAICQAVGIRDEDAYEACVIDLAVTGDVGFVHSARTLDLVRRALAGEFELSAPRRVDAASETPTIEDLVPSGPPADPTPPQGLATDRVRPGADELAWVFADVEVTDDAFLPTSVPSVVSAEGITNRQGFRRLERRPGRSAFGDVLTAVMQPTATDSAAAFEAGTHLPFVVTPRDGPVEVTAIRVTAARGSMTSRSRLELRSSADGFDRSLAYFELGVVQPEMERFELEVDDLVLAGPTEFRLYVMDNATRAVDIADLTIRFGPG